MPSFLATRQDLESQDPSSVDFPSRSWSIYATNNVVYESSAAYPTGAGSRIGELGPSNWCPRTVRDLRWSRFFGQVGKVYSRADGGHWDDEETAPIFGGVQEAGGA